MRKQQFHQSVAGIFASLAFLMGTSVGFAQSGSYVAPPQIPPQPQSETILNVIEQGTTGLSRKQKQEILKDKYKKMKQDATEITKLANELQKSVNSSSSQILSVKIIENAEKIQKLAKKIRDDAKGY